MNPIRRLARRVADRLQRVVEQGMAPSEHLDAWVDQGRAVGAVLHVLEGGRTTTQHAAGWRDRARQLPMEPDTIFDVRSMTKPLVGTAALMLVERQRLRLDDQVRQYLPAMVGAGCGDITVEQLLRHTAGFGFPGFPRRMGVCGGLDAVIADIGAAGTVRPPGTAFEYSDAGSAVLGGVIAAVEGAPVEEVLDQRLLAPLSMTDTFFDRGDDDPRRARMACGYKLAADRYELYWDASGPPKYPFFPAAGGLWSTTTDYAKFLQAWCLALRGEAPELLGAETVRAAMRSTPLTSLPHERGNYGMHWWLYSDPAEADGVQLVFGADGSDGTWAMAAPELDLLVLYFTQSRHGTTLFDMMGVMRGWLEAR
jgi:CubicO group peptidase (beta-lactamase class C family)